MNLTSARSGLWWLAFLAAAVTTMTAGVATAIGPTLTDEGLEQIEHRIRRQREENLRAVHAVIDRLSHQLREQGAELAKDKSRLGSLGGTVPEPDQESLALEAQMEDLISRAPPRPSPDAPHLDRAKDEAIKPELPDRGRSLSLPPDGVDPFTADRGAGLSPAPMAESQLLQHRVLERRAAMRRTIKDLLRARALLRVLGDDAAPPPAIPTPSTNAVSPGSKRNR
jgi:hypothetical protein